LLYAQTDSTKIIQNTFSDTTGVFSLQNLPFGNYVVKIQLISFVPKTLNIALNSQNPTINLGNLILQSDNKLLQSVEVLGKKEVIQKTPQGFIINAEATLTQAGGTATDLLRNTPTVLGLV